MERLRSMAVIAGFALLAGCATQQGSLPSQSANPPPAPVNLSGFPAAYRQGHADGCASAGIRERRDAARYAKDADYKLGWDDGLATCRRR
jgi:uncharacterized lipoprotein YajG